MHSIPPQMWSAFRASLNKDLKTSHSLPGLWITVGSKILEISGRTMHCPQDIPQVPGTSKPTWVRIADPNNPYTSLSKSSQQCAGVVLSALACSAFGTATPAASSGCRGCVCRRRFGRDRGLGNHILPSSLVCRDLEHARHTSRVALPCQAWTAVHRMLRDAGTVSTTASNPQPHWWWALLV